MKRSHDLISDGLAILVWSWFLSHGFWVMVVGVVFIWFGHVLSMMMVVQSEIYVIKIRNITPYSQYDKVKRNLKCCMNGWKWMENK